MELLLGQGGCEDTQESCHGMANLTSENLSVFEPKFSEKYRLNSQNRDRQPPFKSYVEQDAITTYRK